MSPRSIRLPAEVVRAIRLMHPDLRRLVRSALDRIRQNPAAGKALIGDLAGWRSIRVRRLRIVYREARRAIEIAAIGPRAMIYAEAARAIRKAD